LIRDTEKGWAEKGYRYSVNEYVGVRVKKRHESGSGSVGGKAEKNHAGTCGKQDRA
jgi:hypothetical protein